MPKNRVDRTYRTKRKKLKPSKNSVEAVESCGDYFVESVLDHAIDINGKLMYFLKWEGYDESENSWEFEQHLIDCPEVLEDFETTLNGRHPPRYSWQEFDKFKKYLKRVVRTSFADTAVLRKLSNKSIGDVLDETKMTQIKDTIKEKIEPFEKSFDGQQRRKNSERHRAMQLMSEVSKSLKIEENFGSIRQFLEFVDRRAGIEDKLKKFTEKVNKIIADSNEGVAISVANDVDAEVPQLENYICDSIFDKQKFKNKKVEEKSIVYSCECVDCYEERHECCSPVIGFPVAYNKKGVLSSSSFNTNIIFECNKDCKCGPNCFNRVVQRGRRHKLELFRTDDALRGWGVRALESIPKGTYVSAYIGEVVSLNEANRRPTTYLFDLNASWDVTDNEYTYVIDANKYGNIIRFVNHSCEPNCRMIFVWIDSYDKLLPKVCLFTTRPIRANEELTYDYGMQIINIADPDYCETQSEDAVSTDSGNASSFSDTKANDTLKSPLESTVLSTDENLSKVSFQKIECQCGSKQCRKFLYS